MTPNLIFVTFDNYDRTRELHVTLPTPKCNDKINTYCDQIKALNIQDLSPDTLIVYHPTHFFLKIASRFESNLNIPKRQIKVSDEIDFVCIDCEYIDLKKISNFFAKISIYLNQSNYHSFKNIIVLSNEIFADEIKNNIRTRYLTTKYIDSADIKIFEKHFDQEIAIICFSADTAEV